MFILYQLLFITTALSILIGTHVLVLRVISKKLAMTPRRYRTILLFCLLLAMCYPLGRALHAHKIGYLFLLIGSNYMGIFAIALSFFIILLPIALIFKKKSHYVVYFGLFLTFVMIFPAFYNQLRKPKVVELHISSFKIPEELSPFKIVQLSDIHLGRLTSKEWLQSIVDKVNSLKPDVIALTGDMITETVNLDEFSPILRKLESKYGTFAVTGNHEFYVNIQHVENFCDKSFITLLKNSRTEITKFFEIMGVNDDTAKRFGLEGAEVETTLERLDDKKFNLFLSHKPHYFRKASRMGVDLQLSGHTHAGQLPPFTPLIHLIYKYSHGLYSFEDSKIYTTSGVGSFGPAMRLFSRPEIVSISIENP